MNKETDKTKGTTKCNIDSVSKPLIIERLTISTIDRDGDFEIELDDAYTFINKQQANDLIKHLQYFLNVR